MNYNALFATAEEIIRSILSPSEDEFTVSYHPLIVHLNRELTPDEMYLFAEIFPRFDYNPLHLTWPLAHFIWLCENARAEGETVQ